MSHSWGVSHWLPPRRDPSDWSSLFEEVAKRRKGHGESQKRDGSRDGRLIPINDRTRALSAFFRSHFSGLQIDIVASVVLIPDEAPQKAGALG